MEDWIPEAEEELMIVEFHIPPFAKNGPNLVVREMPVPPRAGEAVYLEPMSAGYDYRVHTVCWHWDMGKCRACVMLR